MTKIASLLFILITFFFNAQIVNIPDANFKNYLLTGQSGVNTNGDNEIQVSEAQALNGILNISFLNISDLTGIEAFINIKELWCVGNNLTSLNLNNNVNLEVLTCYVNQLTTLDISNNTKLKTVVCYNNQLTSLNTSNNPKLEVLACAGNNITSLDLSNNIELNALYCTENELTNLDVTNNVKLKILQCFINYISSLNLSSNIALEQVLCGANPLNTLNVKNGNNNIIYNFNAANSPNLYCIQVDNPSSTVHNNWIKDSAANYSTNCNYLNTKEVSKDDIIIYPNPVKDFLNIQIDNTIKKVEIFSMTGKLLKTTINNKIAVSNLPEGNYIVVITTDKDIISEKFIKL